MPAEPAANEKGGYIRGKAQCNGADQVKQSARQHPKLSDGAKQQNHHQGNGGNLVPPVKTAAVLLDHQHAEEHDCRREQDSQQFFIMGHGQDGQPNGQGRSSPQPEEAAPQIGGCQNFIYCNGAEQCRRPQDYRGDMGVRHNQVDGGGNSDACQGSLFHGNTQPSLVFFGRNT